MIRPGAIFPLVLTFCLTASTCALAETRVAPGHGVVVGFLDTGIDWRHEAFRDPSDPARSRILRIWDMTSDAGPAPPGFEYGTEWTREQIEAALRGAGPEPPRDTSTQPQGHGTYVAGVAVGVAPGADIVMVMYAPGRPVSVVDAARYTFDTAGNRSWPAVLSFSGAISVVDYVAQREELESLLTASSGRVLVASAGNGGSGTPHCRFDLTDAPIYTVYRSDLPDSSSEEEVVFLTAYHEGGGARLGLGLSREEMVWTTVSRITSQGTIGETREVDWTLDSLQAPSGEVRARMAWSASRVGDGVWLLITGSSGSSQAADWYFSATGDGVLHTWSTVAPGAMVAGPVDDPAYRPLDNHYTVQAVSSSAEVISVGAYVNQPVPPPYDDLRVGDLFPFSARGPSLEGRMKPDLTGPGLLTGPMSGDSTGYRQAVGTSGASAVVAGAAALVLAAQPRASNRQVRDALLRSVATDGFSGPTPNTDWGHGRLDIDMLKSDIMTSIRATVRLPLSWGLSQNAPNPFNGHTSITYQLARAGHVEIDVYDLLGQHVRTLFSGPRDAEIYQVHWDGATIDGRALASGVYVYRMQVGTTVLTRKLLVLR